LAIVAVFAIIKILHVINNPLFAWIPVFSKEKGLTDWANLFINFVLAQEEYVVNAVEIWGGSWPNSMQVAS